MGSTNKNIQIVVISGRFDWIKLIRDLYIHHYLKANFIKSDLTFHHYFPISLCVSFVELGTEFERNLIEFKVYLVLSWKYDDNLILGKNYKAMPTTIKFFVQ